MLDEICTLGRHSTDEEFLHRLDRRHKGKHDYYGEPGQRLGGRDEFTVRHFAGTCTY